MSWKDGFIEGFITAACLFSGNRAEYEARRDEYLKNATQQADMIVAVRRYDPAADPAANE